MSWPAVFLHPDDRADFYQIAINFARCVTPSSDLAFEHLYNFWEKDISRPLWELCFYGDYFKCGHVVLETARAIGKHRIEAQLLHEMGFCYMERGKLNSAESYLKKSLDIVSELNDQMNMCRVNRYLALVYYRHYDFTRAECHIDIAEKILALHQQDNDQWTLHASALHNLRGSIRMKQGEAIALQYFKEAYQKASMLKKHKEYYKLSSLTNIGKFYRDRGELSKAQPILEQALSASEAISRTALVAGLHIALSLLHSQKENYAVAITHIDKAIEAAGKEHPRIRDKAVALKTTLTKELSV